MVSGRNTKWKEHLLEFKWACPIHPQFSAWLSISLNPQSGPYFLIPFASQARCPSPLCPSSTIPTEIPSFLWPIGIPPSPTPHTSDIPSPCPSSASLCSALKQRPEEHSHPIRPSHRIAKRARPYFTKSRILSFVCTSV